MKVLINLKPKKTQEEITKGSIIEEVQKGSWKKKLIQYANELNNKMKQVKNKKKGFYEKN